MTMPKRTQDAASSSIDYARFEGIPSPNGTIVPDIVLDWILPDLSNAEVRVLLYIIRRTLGFKKDDDAISIDQICNGLVTNEIRDDEGTVVKPAQRLDRGTGLGRSTALNATRALREKNLIVAHEQFDPKYGQRPTRYALKLRRTPDEGSPKNRTPPMGNTQQGGSDFSDGESPIDRTGGVRFVGRRGSEKSDPQTTVKQQTDNQKTDISNRRVSTPRAPCADSNDSSDSTQGQSNRTSGGMAGTAGGCGAGAAVEVVVARVDALGVEFGDDAPRASRTRVAHLQRAAGLDDDTLSTLLDEAASITHSQARGIDKRGRDGRPLHMPYLLRTLESLLGLDRGRVPRASPPQIGTRPDTLASGDAGNDAGSPPIDEPDAVWRAVLGDLRPVLTPENYDAWLATARVIARTDELLRVGVPASFQREWLERKLHGQVMGALGRLGYGDMRVEYVVAPGAAPVADDGDGGSARVAWGVTP